MRPCRDTTDVRIHDLRHTAASILHAGGAPMRAIQDTLGHTRMGTTRDVYTHPFLGAKRASADLLDGFLRGIRA